MKNIIHRIGTEKATIKELYESVSTINGLMSWWTTQVLGKSKVGEVLEFYFVDGGPVFEVLDLQPLSRVEWKCIQGPPEWIDTHIEFNISSENEEAILLFRHSGWREEVEFMHHCSTQWGYFLIGLKKFLETGQGTPYGGNFESISSWTK